MVATKYLKAVSIVLLLLGAEYSFCIKLPSPTELHCYGSSGNLLGVNLNRDAALNQLFFALRHGKSIGKFNPMHPDCYPKTDGNCRYYNIAYREIPEEQQRALSRLSLVTAKYFNNKGETLLVRLSRQKNRWVYDEQK